MTDTTEYYGEGESVPSKALPSHLTESERHRVLTSERRRTTIDILHEMDCPIDLQELSRQVAVRETGDSDSEQVALTLHHLHLPLLDDLDLLEYEPKSTTVDWVQEAEVAAHSTK
ncbi:DUF7344 domain-containing protein [Haloarcula marina]|uniref:DUF7344 domain-containing protein n=1 Tax=Haloarcula marina TaxID=2961574 RepID=UPI0020B753B7|nr:hypothetical protein [Halomicroarcula marina]